MRCIPGRAADIRLPDREHGPVAQCRVGVGAEGIKCFVRTFGNLDSRCRSDSWRAKRKLDCDVLVPAFILRCDNLQLHRSVADDGYGRLYNVDRERQGIHDDDRQPFYIFPGVKRLPRSGDDIVGSINKTSADGLIGALPTRSKVNQRSGRRGIGRGFEDDGHRIHVGRHRLSDYVDSCGQRCVFQFQLATEICASGRDHGREPSSLRNGDPLTILSIPGHSRDPQSETRFHGQKFNAVDKVRSAHVQHIFQQDSVFAIFRNCDPDVAVGTA